MDVGEVVEWWAGEGSLLGITSMSSSSVVDVGDREGLASGGSVVGIVGVLLGGEMLSLLAMLDTTEVEEMPDIPRP